MRYASLAARMLAASVLLACSLVSPGVLALPTPGAGGDAEYETAPVVLDGQVLFHVRGNRVQSAQERASRISQRLLVVAKNPDFDPQKLELRDEVDASLIMAGETMVMGVMDLDSDGAPRVRIAELVRQDMLKAVVDYREARDPHLLLLHTGYAILVTLVAAILLHGLIKLRRMSYSWLQRRLERRGADLKIQSVEVVRSQHVWFLIRSVRNLLTSILVLVILYLHLTTVLGLYPWTSTLAERLFDLFLDPLAIIGAGLLAAVPDLAFVAVLIFLARYVLKAMKMAFDGIEKGTLTFEGFEPEWSMPTYKILRLLVIAFTVVVAYPYIPGSGSQAFKGVSLFLGVIFSLGSSSVIGNVIAGYTMTYRRAFRIGDRIAVGDITGFVTESTLLVTRVRSLKNEEIVIPNSQILASAVINFSALARQSGVIVHTTVGIGYETPWRQVEAMLLMAVERTDGLERDPPPFVLQQVLGDFCINYEINAHCRDALGLARIRTELHRNILDVFNEYDVQIMTPAYEADPQLPKTVARDQWYMAPAQNPAE
jgi:small-conductance mechanosensitive channel